MRQFIDKTGRSWDVEIDGPALVRLGAAGFMPDELVSPAMAESLSRRPDRFALFLYCVLEPQIHARGMQPKECGAMLIHCADAASDALILALTELLPAAQRNRILNAYRKEFPDV